MKIFVTYFSWRKMTLDFYFRAFSISRKADNHARSVPLEANRPEEIRKRKSSGGIDDFFPHAETRLRDNGTGWRAIPKLVKGLYGAALYYYSAGGERARRGSLRLRLRRRRRRRRLRRRRRHHGETISISRGARGKAGLRFIRQLGGLN